MASTKACTIN